MGLIKSEYLAILPCQKLSDLLNEMLYRLCFFLFAKCIFRRSFGRSFIAEAQIVQTPGDGILAYLDLMSDFDVMSYQRNARKKIRINTIA